jgi:hypothetical protein
MNRHHIAVFAALAALMAAGSASAQAPLPQNNPAAEANVQQSEAYTRLLRTNPAFRRQREKIECGPITDPQLRASCIASFEKYATAPNERRAPPSETVR